MHKYWDTCKHMHSCSYTPKVPEEEVSYLAVPLGTLQQEVGKGAVIVGLITQYLHQL